MALRGMLVVSVEQAVAAPLATQRMRAAGARVIKIERPDGGISTADVLLTFC
jgi:crotonobetainyl-CoA:carnitine CoA-transferase CaiB-like acyl-CoA transferase